MSSKRGLLTIVSSVCSVLIQLDVTAQIHEVNRVDDPLISAHLVIKATLESVELRNIHASEWGLKKVGSEFTLDFNRLRISEVIKGAYDGIYITVATPSPIFSTGENVGEVILCSFFNKNYENGQYFVRDPRGIFVKHGEVWRRRYDDAEFTDSAITETIERMSIKHLSRTADIIAMGVIDGIDITQGTDESGRPAQYTTWDMRIEELIKGDVNGDHIDFRMMTGGRSYPVWRTNVPLSVARVQTWIVFLKRFDDRYIPIGGINGFLQVKDDSVLLDGKVPYGMKRKPLVQAIIRELSDD